MKLVEAAAPAADCEKHTTHQPMMMAGISAADANDEEDLTPKYNEDATVQTK